MTGTAGPNERDQMPVEHGLLEGDHVTFNLGPYRFVLEISGDVLRGEMTREAQPAAVVLRRVRQVGSEPAAFEVVSVKRAPPSAGGGFGPA